MKQKSLFTVLIILFLFFSFTYSQAGFKIGEDTSTAQLDNLKLEVQQYFLSALTSVIEYFKEAIKIQHQNISTPSQFNCGDRVQHNGGPIALGDNDYKLYITASLSPQEKFIVIGYDCGQYLTGTNRPYIGNLHINLLNLKLTYDNFKTSTDKALYFQRLIDIIKHEMFHLLALQVPYFEKYNYPSQSINSIYKNPGQNKVRNIQTGYIITEKVKEKVSEHFNCPTAQITGAQLENSDNQDNGIHSHWEATVFNQELMSYSGEGTKYLTKISIALIEDTKWYHSVNYNIGEDMQWGKNKGCRFLDQACLDLRGNYTEFETKKSGCTYDFKATGYISQKLLSENQPYDGCKIMQPLQICIDKQQTATLGLNIFNENSRCIENNIRSTGGSSPGLQQSCFQTRCEGTVVYINLIGIEHKCVRNNQKISIQLSAYQGDILCPSDLERFCNTKAECLNQCSQHGYCVNGKCRCNPNYGGIDCSVECTSNNVVDVNNQCVAENQPTYKCPYGSYLDTSQPVQKTCLKCYPGCKECTGPYYDNCSGIQCINGDYTKSGTRCLHNCVGTENLANCSKCLDKGNACIECKLGFRIQDGKCKTNCDESYYFKDDKCIQCPPSLNCLSCLFVNGQVRCQSCPSELEFEGEKFKYILHDEKCLQLCPYGYYEYNDNGTVKCQICNTKCGHCYGGKETQCLACKDGFVLHDNECLSQCPVNYKDIKGIGKCDADFCLIARKNGQCVTGCENDEFIQSSSKTCIKCETSKCKRCIGYPDKCIECQNPEDYLLDYSCVSQLASDSILLKKISTDIYIMKFSLLAMFALLLGIYLV